MNIQEFEKIKEKAQYLIGKRQFYTEQIASHQEDLDVVSVRIDNAEMARAFLREIANEVQKNLEDKISNIVSTAILAVLEDDPPEFIVRFVERRNVMECDMLFSKRGNEYHPLKGGGWGAADIADFASRIAYGSLTNGRDSYFYDEPFRNVSHDLQPKVSDMLKMMCEELELQIIMVSHQPGVNKNADRVFSVAKGEVRQIS